MISFPNSVNVNAAACTAAAAVSAGNKLNVDEIRSLFPIFAEQADIIYFDNASTTQKPKTVIDAMNEYYSLSCANAGRASYRWATQAQRAMEESRKTVAGFIKANAEDIVFSSGATDSLNTVALSWGLANLKDGDEILLCPEDHKSAVLPWYNVARILAARGVKVEIKTFKIHDVGDYDLKSVKAAVSDKTKVLAMCHIHHVFGLDMEVTEIREIVGDNVAISLDASQSVGHIAIDVNKLPVDFISFSGHKMFAANGVGVLWVNPRRRNEMTPVRVGGGTPDSLQSILEAGTQNIPAIMSLRPAIEFMTRFSMPSIAERVSDLTKLLYTGLVQLPGIEFAPGPGVCGCPGGNGIIAFRFEQIPSTDLCFLLDSENIFVRANDHCLTQKSEGDDYLRVSLHVYNTEVDIYQFLDVLAANVA